MDSIAPARLPELCGFKTHVPRDWARVHEAKGVSASVAYPSGIRGLRRKPQIGVCPLRFVPLSAALEVIILEQEVRSRRQFFFTKMIGTAGFLVGPIFLGPV